VVEKKTLSVKEALAEERSAPGTNCPTSAVTFASMRSSPAVSLHAVSAWTQIPAKRKEYSARYGHCAGVQRKSSSGAPAGAGTGVLPARTS
jgi:hypothetical protein